MNKQSLVLNAKVTARNQVNGAVQLLAPEILAALAPLVGTKVILASGAFSAKLDKALAPFREQRPACRVWFSSGNGYTLTAGVSVNVPIGGGFSGVQYGEETIYLGDLKAGVLASLYPEPAERPIVTAQQVTWARQTVSDAAKAFRDAQSALTALGCGEHDNF